MSVNRQIIYLWIKGDSKGCFEDSEFNFNPKYRIHFKESSRTLTIEETGDENVFESNNIVNLTAVIGNNGVGKTTLLNRLFELPPYCIKEVVRHDDERYRRYYEEKRNDNYYIAVFLVNRELLIVNNYDGPIIYNGKNIGLNAGVDAVKEKAFDDVTKVFFSFSSCGKDYSSSFIEEDRNEFYLHPNNIIREGADFFNGLYPVGSEAGWRGIIKGYCGRHYSFENILIAFSLCNNPILTKRKTIKFRILNMFGEIMSSKAGTNESFKKCISDNWILKTQNIDKDNYLFLAKVNLYLELFAEGTFVFKPTYSPSDEEAWRQANNYIQSVQNNSKKAYYQKAIKEINLLSKIECEFSENLLPKSDLGYRVDGCVSIAKAKELFSLALNDEAPSFLLKYIMFDFGCSDGEMTFFRLNAYFAFIKNRDLFSKNKATHLKHNLLLLLDELDVSMRPKAKQEFIDNLLQMLFERFQGNHCIQLFLTSHSPIILSDIPTQNTIYLKRKDSGKTEVVRIAHQTFGSDISLLYSDAFYFGDSLPIGTFSKKFINDLYKEYEEVEDPSTLRRRINLIGNDLIKKQFGVRDGNEFDGESRDAIVQALKEELEHISMLLRKISHND